MYKKIMAVVFLCCISGQVVPGKKKLRRFKITQEVNVDSLTSSICGCYVRFSIFLDYLNVECDSGNVSLDYEEVKSHKAFFAVLVVPEIQALALPISTHSKKVRLALKGKPSEEKIDFLREDTQRFLKQYQKLVVSQ